MYDFTAALVAFFVLAGVASTAAVVVLVGVVGDLLAARTRAVTAVAIAQPVAPSAAGRRAA